MDKPNDAFIDYCVKVSTDIDQRAHSKAMAISSPKSRVRVYLLEAILGRFRINELAAKLDVSTATVRSVAKAMHYTYGSFGTRDGYWYPSLETLEERHAVKGYQ